MGGVALLEKLSDVSICLFDPFCFFCSKSVRFNFFSKLATACWPLGMLARPLDPELLTAYSAAPRPFRPVGSKQNWNSRAWMNKKGNLRDELWWCYDELGLGTVSLCHQKGLRLLTGAGARQCVRTNQAICRCIIVDFISNFLKPFLICANLRSNSA